MLTVKTIEAEFNSAKSFGYVYGYIVRKERFSVYVELGKEQDYILSSGDNTDTEFKFFVNSTVYIAETDEQLDKQNYVQVIKYINVRLYH